MLAGNEYLKRHSNDLKVLMTIWAVEKGLQEKDHYWCKLKWEQETVTIYDKVRLCWDSEHWMRKEINNNSTKPDVVIKYKDR